MEAHKHRRRHTMKSLERRRWIGQVVGLVAGIVLLCTHPIFAAEGLECLNGEFPKSLHGLSIAPVPLNVEGKNLRLVGLGSYIVNAQGGCNDCHTNPPYVPGGDPFLGEPEQINAAAYLAGGMAFGPFSSANLTACADGKPGGVTFEQFVQVMRTGVDLNDGQDGPPNTPILQVMPWPVYGKMTDCDLRAIYEFLRAIPPHDDQGCTPGGP
jgi:hypothetical protein